MTIRVLAFARIREVVGFSERPLDVPNGMTLDRLWELLVNDAPTLAGLRGSTRFARNGAIAAGTTAIADGDEVALLPPVGGG